MQGANSRRQVNLGIRAAWRSIKRSQENTAQAATPSEELARHSEEVRVLRPRPRPRLHGLARKGFVRGPITKDITR